MSFYVYGRNAKTGEVLHRYLSKTSTEAEARAEARARGVEVTTIVIADNMTDAKAAGLVTAKRGAAQTAAAADDGITAWTTIALIAVNVLLYVARLPGDGGFWQADNDVLVRWGASYGPLTLGSEWWRLLTASFAHDGLPEIVVYSVALFYLGKVAERRFGVAAFLLVFLASAAGGNLFATWLSSQDVHAGVLGAVAGLGGALLAVRMRRGDEAEKDLAVAVAGMGILLFVLFAFLYEELGREIGWAALFGGACSGLLVGLVLVPPADETAGPARIAMAAAVVIGVLGVAVAGTHGKTRAINRTQAVLDAAEMLDRRVNVQLADVRRKWEDCSLDVAAVTKLVQTEILPDLRNVHTRLQELAPYPEQVAGDADQRLHALRLREISLADPLRSLNLTKPACASGAGGS